MTIDNRGMFISPARASPFSTRKERRSSTSTSKNHGPQMSASAGAITKRSSSWRAKASIPAHAGQRHNQIKWRHDKVLVWISGVPSTVTNNSAKMAGTLVNAPQPTLNKAGRVIPCVRWPTGVLERRARSDAPYPPVYDLSKLLCRSTSRCNGRIKPMGRSEELVNGRKSLVLENQAARLVVDIGGGSIGDFHFQRAAN